MRSSASSACATRRWTEVRQAERASGSGWRTRWRPAWLPSVPKRRRRTRQRRSRPLPEDTPAPARSVQQQAAGKPPLEERPPLPDEPGEQVVPGTDREQPSAPAVEAPAPV